MSTPPALDLQTPVLRRLYEDWDSRRAGRAFPARADFDPLDLKYILGRISLLDVLGSNVYRFRLHGTLIAERLGCDLTGKLVSEIPDLPWRHALQTHSDAVLSARAPVVMRPCYRSDGRSWDCEAILFPLSADGTNIDMLIASCIWP